MSRVAVLKGGRSFERQVSLRSGARVEDALERLGPRGHPHRRRSATWWRACATRAPDVAFVALHGRDGEDGTVQELLELVGVPYTASGARRLHPLLGQGRWPSTHLRDAGLPTPDFYAFSETAFEELGAAEALPAIEERLDFPIVVKPAARGRRSGSSSPARPQTCPGALVAAFSYDTEGRCSSATSRAATWRSRSSTGRTGREALPIVEADPAGGGDATTSRRATRSGAHVRLPGRTRREHPRAGRRSSRSRSTGCSWAATGFARVDLMLDERRGELTVLEANAIPGLTETSLFPQAAEAAGIAFEELSRGCSNSRRRAQPGRRLLLADLKSSGVTWSRKSLNLSTTSSVSSTSCSNSIADSAMTSSAAKIGAPDADGQRERIARPRVDLDLAAVDRQRDRRVEGVLAQLGDRRRGCRPRRARRACRTAGRGSSAAASRRPGAS